MAEATPTGSWRRIHGDDAAPPQPRPLTAGDTAALLDGVDLRDVRAGGVEAVRRVYVAVRDENWETIPGEVEGLEVEESGRSFRVTFRCAHRRGAVAFSWNGTISGAPDGTITYAMDGWAERDFAYNRIGFCVLHPPPESGEARYRGEGPDGEVTGSWPRLIAPQRYTHGRYVALHDPVRTLEIDLPTVGRVRFDFDGDLFETEDQRNWTDASLKTYCTPLALGYPHQARAGQPFHQAVRLTVDAPSAGPAPGREDTIALTVGAPSGHTVGAIGLGAAIGAATLGPHARALLAGLAPDHLRLDVHTDRPGHLDDLRHGLAHCAALGVPPEIALHVDARDTDAVDAVLALLAPIELARVLVFAADAVTTGPTETTPAALVHDVRRRIGRADVPVGGGTDMYFCELNRTRPEAGAMDVVAWSVNPQVHATDARSIMETPQAQADTVRTARAFSGDAALAITPITLRPRVNVNALRPNEARDPADADPRQDTLLAAAWTAASLAYLLAVGIASVTYFEATGGRGVIAADPRPGHADVFPIYHVLADLAGWRGAEVLEITVGAPDRLAALALRRPSGLRLLVSNLTPERTSVDVSGLPPGAGLTRCLDSASAERAAVDPDGFRAATAPVEVADGPLRIELGAYAVATIDLLEAR
jgi:hypothetical protein